MVAASDTRAQETFSPTRSGGERGAILCEWKNRLYFYKYGVYTHDDVSSMEDTCECGDTIIYL